METLSVKTIGPLAADVCRDVPLDKPARRLLRPGLTAEEYVWILAGAGHWNDATRVVAQMLPRREAVWWACQCARQTPLPGAAPEAELALQAAEKWVTEMTEESRLAASVAGENAEIGTAAGCAAMGAFSTGGSLTSPPAPSLLSPAGLTAQYVTASLLISALSPDPAKAPAKYRTFLKQGLELHRLTVAS